MFAGGMPTKGLLNCITIRFRLFVTVLRPKNTMNLLSIFPSVLYLGQSYTTSVVCPKTVVSLV
jgi:hypothetical protein